MFHRSISDNIRYGQLDASDKAVRACARLANADEFIKNSQAATTPWLASAAPNCPAANVSALPLPAPCLKTRLS